MRNYEEIQELKETIKILEQPPSEEFPHPPKVRKEIIYECKMALFLLELSMLHIEKGEELAAPYVQ